MRFIFIFSILLLSLACNGSTANNSNKVNTPVTNTSRSGSVSGYEIVNTFPHDQKAFTQGLVVHNGFFYEGTGGYRRSDNFASSLRKVEIETGKVLQKIDLADNFFGEGITILNDKIYQLTWQENTAFVYDLNDFKLIRQFQYAGQGWGLTHDGTNLFLSDGTHVIRVINPETFETVRTVVVLDENGKPLMNLNELEFVKGEIWANVWHSETIGKPNHIARINPQDGKLLGWIDLQGISPEAKEKSSEKTLNGIAYDAASDRIFVTGKLWKNVYEIKLKPKE